MTGQPAVVPVVVAGDTVTVDGLTIACWTNIEHRSDEIMHALAAEGFLGRRAPDGTWTAIRTVDVVNSTVADAVLTAIVAAGGPLSAAVDEAVRGIDFAALVREHAPEAADDADRSER